MPANYKLQIGLEVYDIACAAWTVTVYGDDCSPIDVFRGYQDESLPHLMDRVYATLVLDNYYRPGVSGREPPPEAKPSYRAYTDEGDEIPF